MKSCRNCKYYNGCGGASNADRCNGYKATGKRFKPGEKVIMINPDFSDYYNIAAEVESVDYSTSPAEIVIKSKDFRGARYYGTFYPHDLKRI